MVCADICAYILHVYTSFRRVTNVVELLLLVTYRRESLRPNDESDEKRIGRENQAFIFISSCGAEILEVKHPGTVHESS